MAPPTTTSFLCSTHGRLLGAICDRVLPPGPEGPSASEAHVLQYIDRQLAGPWGQGARMYRQGPFLEPSDAGHGWQSALTPAEVYRSGLAAVRRHVRDRYDAEFSELAPGVQDEILRAWSAGEVRTFEDVDGPAFFELVRQNVIEGLLSDPCYGGNHQMVGWRWLGFPGVPSLEPGYREQIGSVSAPSTVEPRALTQTEPR